MIDSIAEGIAPALTGEGPAFFEDLGRFGERPALFHEGEPISYAALEGRVADWHARLAGRRRLVFLEAGNEPESIACYLACLRAACPVYLFGPGEIAKTERLIELYHPEWVVSRDGQVRTGPTTAIPLAADLRLLLSTSGSTGSPKLVKLSRRNIGSNAESIVDYLGITAADRAITTLQFNYSYGMSILNSYLAAGASIVLTELSMIDAEFWQLAQRLQVTSLSGVPHNFELLRQRLKELGQLRSLRYVTQAGGRLAPETAVEFAALGRQQGWQLFIMYGQTEASPRMAYLPPELVDSHADHIGVAIPGGSLLLLDEQGQAIEGAGRDGELAYRGPNVMMGYAQQPADLARDETPPLLKTGDIARRNEQGLFKIVGRSSRFVKPFGLRVNLDEVEAEARRSLPDAVSAGNDELIVIASAQGEPAALAECAARLAQKYKLPAASVEALKLDEIPRLANGKVDYRQIVAQAVSRAAAARGDDSLASAIAAALNVARVEPGDTFVGLGGDSLSFVNVALLIEQRKARLPEGWETMPIGELEALPPAAPPAAPAQAGGLPARLRGWGRVETNVLLRGLAVLVVVFDHALATHGIGSASLVLFLVAGFNFSRFQVPKILGGAALEPIRSTALRVVLPYYVFVTVTLAWHGRFFLPQYLFVGNFTEGVRNARGDRLLVPYWFIENYVIYVLAFVALLSVPAVREFARRQGWRLAAGLFAACMALGVLAAGQREWIAFDGKTCLSVAWIFVLGWLVHQTATAGRRHLVAGVGLAAIAGMTLAERPELLVSSYLGCALLALLALVYVPEVRLPRVLVPALSAVAGASLYIYIAHPLVVHFLRERATVAAALAAVLISAVVGIALSRFSLWAERRLRRLPPAGA